MVETRQQNLERNRKTTPPLPPAVWMKIAGFCDTRIDWNAATSTCRDVHQARLLPSIIPVKWPEDLLLYNGCAFTVTVSPDSNWIATVDDDENLRLCNIRWGFSDQIVLGLPISYVKFSPNSRFLAVVHAGGDSVLVYEIQQSSFRPLAEKRRVLPFDSSSPRARIEANVDEEGRLVEGILFSKDSSSLMVLFFDFETGSCYRSIWDLESGIWLQPNFDASTEVQYIEDMPRMADEPEDMPIIMLTAAKRLWPGFHTLLTSPAFTAASGKEQLTPTEESEVVHRIVELTASHPDAGENAYITSVKQCATNPHLLLTQVTWDRDHGPYAVGPGFLVVLEMLPGSGLPQFRVHGRSETYRASFDDNHSFVWVPGTEMVAMLALSKKIVLYQVRPNGVLAKVTRKDDHPMARLVHRVNAGMQQINGFKLSPNGDFLIAWESSFHGGKDSTKLFSI